MPETSYTSDEMMTIADALGEARDVARAHYRFPAVLDQHPLAREHDDQLVLAVVPMALARPGAGLERDMARAEIGQASGWSEAAVPASGDRLVERRRIAGAVGLGDLREIDFRHGAPLATGP